MEPTENERKEYRKMTGTPIPRLIVSLAGPTAAGSLVTAGANLADTYFVSQLGTRAAGAVGVAFALTAVMQAVGYTFGMGSGGVISFALGKKDRETASLAAAKAFWASLLLGGGFAAFGLAFLRPLLSALGATATILPFSVRYAGLLLFGAPFQCAFLAMNNLLRAEGKMLVSMVGTIAAGLLGIGLDPLFIFGFHMGIAGAAAAALTGQSAGFLILLAGYLRKRAIARIRLRDFLRRPRLFGEILRIGAPSFFRQGLTCAATILLNVAAAAYGDAAVAAMSIVGRAFFFILAALLGFGQGLQPVAGYNFGARKPERLVRAFRFSVTAATAGLVALCFAGYLLAPGILTLFRRDDARVIAIGVTAFRFQCAVTPLQAFVVVSNMLFQAIGKEREASLIAGLRQGICFLPLILILPRLFGLTGVQVSQPAADALSFFVCLPVTLRFLRKLKRAAQTGDFSKIGKIRRPGEKEGKSLP